MKVLSGMVLSGSVVISTYFKLLTVAVHKYKVFFKVLEILKRVYSLDLLCPCLFDRKDNATLGFTFIFFCNIYGKI